jgi:hypothetical protein
MKTFLDYFNIPKDTITCDFLDIDIEKDTPLYIDSYYLTWAQNKYCKEALSTQKVFMEELMLALKNADHHKAQKLCSHFSEPKFTGLGVSQHGVNGRGAKDIKVKKILDCLKSSKAAQTGLLKDLEELILVTENIGPDTISDITTNICLKHFADYTKSECLKLGIKTYETNESFHYFCKNERKWKKTKFDLPHVEWGENKIIGPVILLPIQILDHMISYNANYLFTNIATPIYKDEALKKYPTASFIYSVKNNTEKRVRVRDLRNLYPEYRYSKVNMDNLIATNPKLLDEYREKVAQKRYTNRKK